MAPRRRLPACTREYSCPSRLLLPLPLAYATRPHALSMECFVPGPISGSGALVSIGFGSGVSGAATGSLTGVTVPLSSTGSHPAHHSVASTVGNRVELVRGGAAQPYLRVLPVGAEPSALPAPALARLASVEQVVHRRLLLLSMPSAPRRPGSLPPSARPAPARSLRQARSHPCPVAGAKGKGIPRMKCRSAPAGAGTCLRFPSPAHSSHGLRDTPAGGFRIRSTCLRHGRRDEGSLRASRDPQLNASLHHVSAKAGSGDWPEHISHQAAGTGNAIDFFA